MYFNMFRRNSIVHDLCPPSQTFIENMFMLFVCIFLFGMHIKNSDPVSAIIFIIVFIKFIVRVLVSLDRPTECD